MRKHGASWNTKTESGSVSSHFRTLCGKVGSNRGVRAPGQGRPLRLYHSEVKDSGPLAGVVLQVWVSPRSSPERIGRLADGRIRAYVSPPPERGKANARLIALLAKLLRVPRDSIEILSGTSHPKKLIRVGGCSEAEVNERIPPLPSGHYVGAANVRRRARNRIAKKRARTSRTGAGI